ncbi:MAG: hypothetical protein AAB634_02810 [Patescibacteria group bacterium]
MAKTARHARQHAEALAELFSDIREVTTEAMDALINHYEKKKYLRQSLQRLIERGIIDSNPTKYLLTKKGERFFETYRSRYPLPMPPKSWDGKWRIVSFDVPGEYRIERDQIRALLKEFNFYLLHKSVWISPSYLSQDFWKTLVEANLHPYCKVMLVEILEGDEDIRKRFHLS